MISTIETRDVQVGDHSFHLSETGPRDAEPIVWLHGSGPGVTALSNWEWMIGDLGDEFHNVAPDVIGFGDSTHPDPPPQGMGAFTALRVDTLLSLLDALKLSKVNLVGNSMGGIISLALVQKAPQRVNRIVLMGSGGAPVPLTDGLRKLITFYDNPTADAMAELLTLFVHDPAFFGDDLRKVAEARIPRATRPEVERSHRATFSMGGPPLRFAPEDLAKITNKILVVHGDDDRIVLPDAGKYFAEHLPNARLEIFKDTGHWLQLEQGPKFAQLVRAFLKED